MDLKKVITEVVEYSGGGKKTSSGLKYEYPPSRRSKTTDFLKSNHDVIGY